MRQLRRNRNKKQVRLVLGVVICLICVMTVGYAAFSTNISLNAKGNVIKKGPTAAELLKANVVTSGDGLYVDSTEEGKYVYKGAATANGYIGYNGAYNAGANKPVVFLSADIKLRGKGTYKDPYTIVTE